MRTAAEKALSLLGYEGAELSVLITGDRRMRTLNRLYRGMDRTTDVLSFSVSESGGIAIKAGEDGPPVVLGDVVISAPKAAAQAAEANHSIEREMVLLLIHGILHIAGYDHEQGNAERRKMDKKAGVLMDQLWAR